MSKTKVGEHIPCRYSMFTIWAFDSIEHKHDLCRGEYYMKKFFESLRDNYEENWLLKKKTIPLTKKKQELHDKNLLYLGGKSLNVNAPLIKNIVKLKNIAIILVITNAAHSISNLKYNIPKNIHVVFHNELSYNYDFMIKEPAKDFKEESSGLGEYNEKYKAFSVPIIKAVKRINKSWEEMIKHLFQKLQFIDNAILMTSSLPNLAKGIHKIQCKHEHD